MRIKISDATLTDEMAAFLRGEGCEVRRVDRDVLEVEAHPTLADEQARMELDLLLRFWRSLKPRVRLYTSD